MRCTPLYFLKDEKLSHERVPANVTLCICMSVFGACVHVSVFAYAMWIGSIHEIGYSHSVAATITVVIIVVVVVAGALFGICFPEFVDRFALHSLVHIGCMSKCLVFILKFHVWYWTRFLFPTLLIVRYQNKPLICVYVWDFIFRPRKLQSFH